MSDIGHFHRLRLGRGVDAWLLGRLRGRPRQRIKFDVRACDMRGRKLKRKGSIRFRSACAWALWVWADAVKPRACCLGPMQIASNANVGTTEASVKQILCRVADIIDLRQCDLHLSIVRYDLTCHGEGGMMI
jgi:hypothetical protein